MNAEDSILSGAFLAPSPPPPSPALSREPSVEIPPLPPSLPPSPPPSSPIPPPVPFVQLPLTQAYLFSALTQLHQAMTGFAIQAKLRKLYGPHTHVDDFFRFFLKGGAVAPLLMAKYTHDPIFHRFPFLIENDIDCEVLINPTMPAFDFHQTLKYVLATCVNVLTGTFSAATPFRTALKKEWGDHGYSVTPCPPTYFSVNFISEDTLPGRHHKDNYMQIFSDTKAFETMKPESLFRMRVFSEYFNNRRSLLMMLIQIIPNVEGGTSILEIAIPKQAHPTLRFDWKNAVPERFATTIPYFETTFRVDLPIVDAPFLYLDQRISANRVRNTAPEKHASRTRRANLIRNRLLRPRRTTANTNNYHNDPLFVDETVLFDAYRPKNILANTQGWKGGRRTTRRYRRK
jgi:hypothetical protein